MTADRPPPFRRRVLRKAGYDYSLSATYFVTVCTQDKVQSLASIMNGVIELMPAGAIIDRVIQTLPERFPFVTVEAYVVMPNHVHCLLRLEDATGKDSMPGHLGGVVRTLKATSTRLIRVSGLPGFAWQPNYYDHVVRTEADLRRIHDYIAANPAN